MRKERAVGALKAARAAGRCSLPLHSRAQTHKHTHVAPGLIQADPEGHFSYETLEEIALSVQEALKGRVVPHCAFNGGRDVWVDVGNKALGIRALQVRGGKGPARPAPAAWHHPWCSLPPSAAEQAYFGAKPECTVHIGDRFTRTGNDRMAREVANTVWVANPRETERYVRCGQARQSVAALHR